MREGGIPDRRTTGRECTLEVHTGGSTPPESTTALAPALKTAEPTFVFCPVHGPVALDCSPPPPKKNYAAFPFAAKEIRHFS